MKPKKWIRREDSIDRCNRTERLQWLIEQTPDNAIYLFHGGSVTKYLYEEARYCFVYGQFLASITLGLSFLERTLASIHFASGRDDLERAGIARLIEEALEKNWINRDEYDQIENARKNRNRILHFRSLGDEDTIEFQAITDGELPYTIFEEEARCILKIVFVFIEKFSWG